MTDSGGADKTVPDLAPGPAPGFADHPDHNIDLERCPERQRAFIGDVVIADSAGALVMREANYPSVIYFPRCDVNMGLLRQTDHSSYCPFKGNASYWSIISGDTGGENAAWSYETPYDEMATLKDYIAFYADSVQLRRHEMEQQPVSIPNQTPQLPQAQVAGLYNRLSRVYDIWAGLTESKARARALELADVSDGEQVLEVAVGTGLAFAEIVRRNPGGRNVGIDLSPGMLGKAEGRLKRQGLSNFKLSVGSAFEIAEPDASFDILMNNYMFDLLAAEDWPRVLAEFHRLLKPGGRLVLSGMTPGEGFGSGIYDRLYNLSPSLMGGCRGVLMAGPIAGNGFSVASRDYMQQMLFPSEIILAKKL